MKELATKCDPLECGALAPLSVAGDLSPTAAGQAPPEQSAVKPAHSKDWPHCI